MTTATAAAPDLKPMTVDDSRRLHDYTTRIRDELALLELAGCGDTEHARSLRDVRARVLDSIAAARTARADLEASLAAEQRMVNDQREKRARDDAEQLARAVSFLSELVLPGRPVPRDEVLQRAAKADICDTSLLAAASQLGIGTVARYGRRGRVWRDSVRAWAIGWPGAGWSQEGPATLR